jgi:predicted permease
MVAGVLTSLEAIDMARALRRVPRVDTPTVRARPRRGLVPISWLDFKLGVRMLARYPGLTLVAGFAMAFTVWTGAGTFEIVTQALYPSIPLDEGDRIVALELYDTRASEDPRGRMGFDFLMWQERLESVEELGAFARSYMNLVVDGDVGDPIVVASMTASGFQLARVPPLLGRVIVPADEVDGAPPVTVLSHRLWLTRFGGDANVLGRVVRVGNEQPTVIGVMPDGYAFPMVEEAWVPLRRSAFQHPPGEGPTMQAFGRLSPGATADQVEAEMSTIVSRLASAFPDTHASLRPVVMPLARAFFGLPPDFWHVFSLGALSFNVVPILLLLLIAANVALLMFARAAAREGEIVVRTALGAGRQRIVGQLFAEALVLGAVAAGVGLGAASFGLRWAFDVYQGELFEGRPLPFWFHPTLSPPTLVYAALLTVLGAAVAGVLPGLKVTRGLGSRLKETSAGGGGLRLGGVWTAVIVTQVAVTLPIPAVVWALRGERSEIEEVTIGVPVERYLAARVEIEAPFGADGTAMSELYASSVEELERRLESDARVLAVTRAERLPREYHPWNRIEVLEGAAEPPDERGHRVGRAAVALDFFDALDAPILAGRAFGTGDLEPEVRVVLVNASFVERVLGGRNAVGRHLRFVANESARVPTTDGPWYEIVGVVRDLGAASGFGPQGVYVPLRRDAPRVQLILHARGDPFELMPALRATAMAVDPSLEIHDVISLDQVVRSDLEFYDFWITLVVAVSVIALVLSLAGTYAAMSFAVARRTREIGIRIALGASRRGIIVSILRRPLVQLAAGVLLGCLFTVGLMGGAERLLAIREWLVMAAYTLTIGAIIALACVVPTRRALAIEPSDALRTE